MAKFSARDIAMVTVSMSIGAAVALLARLPAMPDGNAMMGLIGALLGAAVAVIAGLTVLARQFETVDQRNLQTMRTIVARMKVAGRVLGTEDAPLNPVPIVQRAARAFRTGQRISRELQASGPNIAAAAELFDESDLSAHFQRLLVPGIGIATPDLTARSSEIVAFADRVSNQLEQGL
jgi:hypothetical protein